MAKAHLSKRFVHLLETDYQMIHKSETVLCTDERQVSVILCKSKTTVNIML